jgi:2-iminobutanoate/2-iminopropanoate deaminase
VARQSINIESFKHGNPIPAATRIGPYVTCSITPAFNPGTRDLPETLDEQINNLFIHVGQMLEGAGATWDDVAKMTFYVVDPAASREALNGPWVERFPDPASRPSRHNMKVQGGGAALISCDFVAFVTD